MQNGEESVSGGVRRRARHVGAPHLSLSMSDRLGSLLVASLWVGPVSWLPQAPWARTVTWGDRRREQVWGPGQCEGPVAVQKRASRGLRGLCGRSFERSAGYILHRDLTSDQGPSCLFCFFNCGTQVCFGRGGRWLLRPDLRAACRTN